MLFFLFVPLFLKSQETKKVDVHLTEDIRVVKNVLIDRPEVRHGMYQYYFEGKLMVEGHYHANKKHGAWTRYHLNGLPQIKAFYLSGKEHGSWSYYYPSGKEMAKVNFVKGKKHGIWQAFHISGNTSTLKLYQNDFAKESRYYHDLLDENGQVILAYKYKTQIQGSDTISYVSKYYENGQLFVSNRYKNNKLDSICSSYHKNGFLWKSFEYDNGSLVAIKAYKTRIGTQFDKGTFREGNGELLSYDYDSELKSKVHYSSGLPNGKALYYNKGVLWAEGYFSQGKRAGKWTYYDGKQHKKKPEIEYNFVQDNEVEMTLYAGTNSGRWQGTFIDNKKEGIWNYYNQYDELIIEHNFHFGFRHGTSKRYRGAMAIAEEGEYYYGLKAGEWKYYNNNGKVVYSEYYGQEISADEQFLKKLRHIDNLFENAYYRDRNPIRVVRPSLFSKGSRLGRFYQHDNREVLPIPDEASEFDFQHISYRESVGFAGTKREIRVTVDEVLKEMESNDQRIEFPGIYSWSIKTDYFGYCEDIQPLRQLGYLSDSTLIEEGKAYKFWNPAMRFNLPREVKTKYDIGIYNRAAR